MPTDQASLLRLQRSAGNEVVRRLLAGAPAANSGAFQPPVAHAIQRKLKFRTEAMHKPSGMRLGKSGYTKIQGVLKSYWEVVEGESFEEKQAARHQRLVILRTLDESCKTWLAEKAVTASTGKDDMLKEESVQKLSVAVAKELRDEEYRARYAAPDPDVKNALLESVNTNTYAFAKARKRGIKHGTVEKRDLEPQQISEIKAYQTLKAAGLTWSEISALHAYTGHQYVLMNPAQAEDKTRLEGNMAAKGRAVDTPEKVETAYQTNRDLVDYATSGYDKLEFWKQTQPVYRGETVSRTEGDSVAKDYSRTYPNFVSTSWELDTPRTQIRDWLKPERPYALIFHITKSYKQGKNIQHISKQGNLENEILYPKGTTLLVTEVLPTNKPNYKEVKAIAK